MEGVIVPAKKIYFTEEEKLEAKRDSYRKYNKSDKRKAVRKKFEEAHKDNIEKKEKYKESREKWYESLTDQQKEYYYQKQLQQMKELRKKDPRRPMLSDARKRAKKKNLEFDLVIEDLTVPDFCPILGIPLFVAGGKRTDNSPSLDRVNNSKGYTRDNVLVISFRANALKNDATLDELKSIVKYMEEHLGLARD